MIAEKYERSGVLRYRQIAETARAAEELVGTERGKDLVLSGNLNRMYRDLEREYDVVGAGIATTLDSLLDNSTLNKPLGSGYSDEQWQNFKTKIQYLYRSLIADGYTHYEIAAALAYGRYLYRG